MIQDYSKKFYAILIVNTYPNNIGVETVPFSNKNKRNPAIFTENYKKSENIYKAPPSDRFSCFSRDQ